MSQVRTPLSRLIVITIACLSTIAGCGPEVTRNPLPRELVDQAVVPGYGRIRSWGDQIGLVFGGQIAQQATRPASRPGEPNAVLALSGGGSQGAFGAGLLCGWTARGDRPAFRIVTGISTGAIIAPFAFLGPKYDDQLKAAYTQVGADDIYVKRIFTGLIRGDSLADNSPLVRLAEKYVDQAMLEEVAREHARGRRLYVGTTNMDMQRPVFWDLGAIASSGRPDALRLFRRIVIASASIPVAFPPVYLEVEAGGKTYDEMHVDGAVTAEVFIWGFGEALPAASAGKTGPPVKVYVIRNASIECAYKAIEPRVLPIAERSLFTLINSQAVGDLYRIYSITRWAGYDFLLAHIPDGDAPLTEEQFNKEEMNRLFNRGYEMGSKGYPWKTLPPGFPNFDPPTTMPAR